MFSDLGAVVLWQIFYCAKDLVLVVITKLKYREKAMGEQTDKNDVLPAQTGKVEWYDRETGKSALYRQCRKSECIRAADPPLSFFMIHPPDAMSALKKGALAQQPEPPLFFYLTVIPILFISFLVQSSLGSSQSCDRHTERRTGYIV